MSDPGRPGTVLVVDDQEDLRRLLALGVDLAQGYLFGRPEPLP